MPTAPTYPGVYIEEVPSGVRTIVGVSTSTGAFIGFFHRGPIDVPVRMFSFADFERVFGGLHRESEASYAIQQFFLNGGTEAYVVRVGAGSIDTAHETLTGGGTDMFEVRAGRRVGGVAVDDPGSWGNALRLEVDYDTTQPDVTFNLTASEVGLRNGRPVVLRAETFRNLTMEPRTPGNAIDSVNERSSLVQFNRDGMPAVTSPFPTPPATFRPDATGTLGETVPSPAAIPSDGDELQITIDPDGTATSIFTETVTLDYAGSTPTTYAQLRPFLENAIRDADRNEPLLAGAVVQFATNRFRVLLGRADPSFNPAAEATFQDIAPTATATDLGMAGVGVMAGPQQIELSSGDDGSLPSSAAPATTDWATAIRGVRNNKTGLYALEDSDIFNILCVPVAARLADADMRNVYGECEAYCAERRAFLIIDIPDGIVSVDGMSSWLDDNANLRDRNAAVCFPRVRISDPLNQGRLRSIGPSGTMAGLYARTDVERGVWKAPAGTEARLRNVQDLDYVLTDRENGALNPVGVNCLRTFPIYGNVSWGARTLDGADVQASEWKYIPVRRLALFLEESLFRGTKWVVFEPNDEPLWSQVRLNVGSFMQRLFRQGAFQGQTPQEAYLVRCDGDTTTQEDIDLGIVNIVVGFAPLKPAEFVIIKIQQIARQLTS